MKIFLYGRSKKIARTIDKSRRTKEQKEIDTKIVDTFPAVWPFLF